MATVLGRLAASCRPQVQHLSQIRAVGLALVPVLWMPWDTLAYASWTSRYPRGVRGSKPGRPHPVPCAPPLRVLHLPRLQGPRVFAPRGSPEWRLSENPQPFLRTQAGLRGGLGVISVCLRSGSGLTSYLTLRDENQGKNPSAAKQSDHFCRV